MFHLAARGLSPPEQRRLIDRLNGRARIVREYLVANVLEPISVELRTFLVDTCVLGVVTPALADQLRGDTGSVVHLRELMSSQLFTVAIDDDTYRYHEVLRTQLEVLLIERDGEERTAQRYRAAGALLEGDHYVYDALRCFARGGDWPAVRRLADHAVHSNGHADAGTDDRRPRPTAWIGDVPASIVADDPWLLLARARAERLDGRWTAAMSSIQAADQKGVGAEFAEQCRKERDQLTVWLEPVPQGSPTWVSHARLGCRRDPLAAAVSLDAATSEGLVAAAALRLLAGDLDGARRAAERAINDEALGPFGVCAGLAVLAIGRLLERAPEGTAALDQAEVQAERAGFGWIARFVRASLAVTDRPHGVDEAVRTREQCARDGDPWGAALAALLGGLGAARRRQPAAELLAHAASGFAGLDANALASLCAIASIIDRGGSSAEASAEARASGVTPMIALLDDFIGRPPSPATAAKASAMTGPDAPQPLVVQCLGPFSMSSNDRELGLHELRPRARMLLKMLAIHVPNGVHRESIVDGLWPDCETAAGIHNVQVATSSIRKLFSAAGVPDHLGVQRSGEAYRLVLADDSACDLSVFVAHANAAKTSLSRGERDDAFQSASAALSIHQGALLAEDGPLEWIVSERTWVSALHETMATIAASWHVDKAQFREAIEVCQATILQRPYADELWRLLILAHRQRGDVAAASQAQRRYDSVLAELGA
jgi:DNA-binding SARP family transcriptional activator